MHVLYIHQHFATPADSIGTRSYELSKSLIEAGHEVTMLCGDTVGRSDSEAERISREKIAGINVVRITEPYSNSMGFMSRVFSFLRFAFTASVVAYKEKPDMIYATSTPLTVGIPAMVSKFRTSAPFVFEVRDLWPTLPIAMGAIKNPIVIWLLRMLEKTIYRRSDAIVTLAPGMEEEIKTVKGAPSTIEFIPNGCDTDLFNPKIPPAKHFSDINYENFNLIYCGHHGVANGLDSIVDAAIELKKMGTNSVCFVMVGKGSEKQRLVEVAKKQGVSDFFTWLDPIPKTELAALLPTMNVGLMPLMNVKAFHNGTSPNKFFDYISSGIPVITNYPGWIAELIKQNQCGEVVQPDAPAELANAIVKMSSYSKATLSESGSRSRQMAESRFARSSLGARFVNFLEKIHADTLA